MVTPVATSLLHFQLKKLFKTLFVFWPYLATFEKILGNFFYKSFGHPDDYIPHFPCCCQAVKRAYITQGMCYKTLQGPGCIFTTLHFLRTLRKGPIN
jgi:hypothetical protein